MIVNLYTQSDADFVRAFVLAQSVPDWLATTYYPIASQVAYADQVWNAAAASTNVVPGTDITKWTLGTRPRLNLTGSTLMLMARAPVDSPYAPLSVTTVAAAGIVITNAAAGEFTLTLPVSALSKMPAGVYQQSLIRVRPDTLRELVWHGTLTHKIGPTR